MNIEKPPGAAETAVEQAQMARFINRARMMNLIHEGLLSAGTFRELNRITVAASVWPTGMGFSRSFLFKRDAQGESFVGSGAFGVASREVLDRLRDEVEKESETFNRTIFDPSAGASERIRDESLLSHHVEDLGRSALWMKLAGDFLRENVLLERVRELRLPAPATAPGGPAGESDDLLARILRSKTCVAVGAGEIANSGLPAPVRAILTADTLWAVIRTGRGARMILVVDRLHDDQRIDEVDHMQMDWFANQLGLAYGRAELLTELTQTNESLKNLDSLKSNFLSTISHELRSPLTSIMGFTRLLANGQMGEVAERQRDILNRVLGYADKLSNTLNDLIEIVEIDSGITANIQIEPVDPLNILMQVLPRLEPRRQSKEAVVEPVFESTVPLIMADQKRLARIFYHLIDNALKFSPKGGRVGVEFTTRHGELAIRISDAGIGIPKEKLQKIFGAFYQIDSQLSRGYEGMGIGLTVTTKLVQGTGGRLSAESEPGRGSVFTILYPLA